MMLLILKVPPGDQMDNLLRLGLHIVNRIPPHLLYWLDLCLLYQASEASHMYVETPSETQKPRCL